MHYKILTKTPADRLVFLLGFFEKLDLNISIF